MLRSITPRAPEATITPAEGLSRKDTSDTGIMVRYAAKGAGLLAMIFSPAGITVWALEYHATGNIYYAFALTAVPMTIAALVGAGFGAMFAPSTQNTNQA